ncbi:MAG: carbohydrate binding domain-containing protein [Ruminococcus sp.]|uniref:GDSL-type esterase/lipase family protein n=1 Tax=Ruminococcus sp. TaxID=41978 RepID=UPI0025CE8EF8|nr:GDSL-type esterase/lipase family protein [Ruminococcus sp.]MCR4795119.1 carbohydrate binding domain-containing protein [Ruminococcus sp.]
MKKKITAALAAAIAATAVGATVSAATVYSPDTLKKLGSFLLGKDTAEESMDVNSDKTIDIFDMVEMRKAASSTSGEFTSSVIAPTEKNVNYINRNAVIDGVTWLVQSGAAVEFNITSAKSASVVIKGDNAINNGDNYRPRYAVIVDDKIILDECLSKKEKAVELFSGDTPRNATVKVIHLSEANNGPIGISAINVVSDAASPVTPTPEKELHIEFVGDSITCAYGVEGKDQYEGFKTSTENFMKSYAYLTAQKLGAEYSTACYSGYGAVSAYSGDGSRNTSGLIGSCYNNIGNTDGYNIPWSHSDHPVDVVVVNIGTNDHTYVSKDYDKRGPEFTEAYVELLASIHKAQPKAFIVCTVGTMGCAEMYPYIEEAIKQFKTETDIGDRIISYLSATQDMNNDGLGSDWHPTYATQQRSAAVLTDKICRLIGRESDQVGLDVSADAEYKAVLNESSGANAATYFSDYDRSFWVNVVTGGSKAEDVQSVLSPISLKKNGKYKLSFKATAPEGSKLPVQVRSKDGSAVYYDGFFTSNGEKTPFEAEFSADTDDASAEFSISFGGKDYSSVTIYELKLIKTA